LASKSRAIIISNYMIKYTLICENNHEFEGWFPNSKEYGRQQKKQMICCPSCDSSAVTKAIMAPNVNKSKTKVKNKPMPVQNQMMPASQAHNLFRRIGKYVKKNFEDVGENFYKEALKSDNGERDDKFYGTPSDKQVDDLLEKGIDLFHVPKSKDN
jgi:hypothetical protein